MKKRLYVALVMGIAFICFNQCHRVPFCYNIPQDFWNDYFPYETGDTVIFQNEFNETKTFVVEDVRVNFGIYEPFTDDADPTPHCNSSASVKLSNGEESILHYFNMLGSPYEKEKYSFLYSIRFDFPQDALPGAEYEWWKRVQSFANQQYGKINSIDKLFGKMVEFEKESYDGESPNNIYEVKSVRGKGLYQFREEKRGCSWKLMAK